MQVLISLNVKAESTQQEAALRYCNVEAFKKEDARCGAQSIGPSPSGASPCRERALWQA